MDQIAFDRLSRSLAASGPRRGLLQLLAALPVAGALGALRETGTEAGGRHKRRTKRNKRHSGNDKQNRKGKRNGKNQQKPPAAAPLSPPPPGCTPTTCAAQGKNCGVIADGCGREVRCGPDSCGAGYTCTDNRCLCPDGTAVCEGVCCQNGQICQNGNGPCCTDSTCPANANCGTIPNICGGTITCGGSCGGDTPVCSSGNVCVACSASNLCPAGGCCTSSGACVAAGASCDDGDPCTTGSICSNGVCGGGTPVANRTVCAGSGTTTSVCCNGTCCPGCCDGDGNCGACRVFVTSSQNPSNMGGLMGADVRCQDLAESAGLPGTYQAWLSDTTGSPSSRFRCTQASCSTQGYVLVDGTTVATDWADLTNGSLAHAINIDEHQKSGFSALVWTNTLANGTPGGFRSAPDGDCANWGSGGISGNSGSSSSTNPEWTDFTIGLCNINEHKLYCFQQD